MPATTGASPDVQEPEPDQAFSREGVASQEGDVPQEGDVSQEGEVSQDAAATQDAAPDGSSEQEVAAARDIAEVPAVEVITSAALHLMSAAAVKTGLAEEGEALQDLDEARKLIHALAGLVTAARGDLGVHAAPLRDGLASLQAAFREASRVPDAPGEGPGERFTTRGS